MRRKCREFLKNGKLYRDDRGATLVVVIVSMLLLSVLASVILYTTYVNYKIKVTELHSTDNFYTAEMVMEEIKAGLEKEVSESFTEAYLDVMQNYNAYNAVERTIQFQNKYLGGLQKRLASAEHPNQVNKDVLENYISPEHETRGAIVELEIRTEGDSDPSLIKYTDSILIKGLELTYTDTSGYVAVIATDIVLKIPNMFFEEGGSLPDVLAYSLIADKELHFINGGTYTVKGSIYGGSKGIFILPGANVSFTKAETDGDNLVVTGGNVNVTGTGGEDSARLSVSGDSALWADGIAVDSAGISLLGSSYVQDDLTVNGKNCSVTLSGVYYGFGYKSVSTVDYGAQDSSSILINGAHTSLDMSALTVLGLAGQAYIGTTDADGDGVEDEAGVIIGEDGNVYDTSGNQSVRMGESLSVRSNQLAYLVPAECIGYINGECVLGSNPVSLASYQEYVDAAAGAGAAGSVEVDLSKATLGGEGSVSLHEYGASWQKVFYQAAGSGTNAWVYYYLKFNSAQQANRFFADYYNQNKAALNRYMQTYLSDYRVPAGLTKMNLAGNAVYFDPGAGESGTGEFVLEPAGMTGGEVPEGTDPALAMIAEYEGYANTFKALNVNLTMNYAALTQEQIDRASVFHNVVDVEKLRLYMDGEAIKEVAAVGGQKILLVDNEAGGEYTIPADSSVKAVVATGDVRVSSSFRGMILSGGKIYVTNDAVIEPDPNAVSLALQADGGKILACFREGEAFTELPAVPGGPTGTPSPTPGEGEPSGTPEEENDEITTESLVSYRNWKKY